MDSPRSVTYVGSGWEHSLRQHVLAATALPRGRDMSTDSLPATHGAVLSRAGT